MAKGAGEQERHENHFTSDGRLMRIGGGGYKAVGHVRRGEAAAEVRQYAREQAQKQQEQMRQQRQREQSRRQLLSSTATSCNASGRLRTDIFGEHCTKPQIDGQRHAPGCRRNSRRIDTILKTGPCIAISSWTAHRCR